MPTLTVTRTNGGRSTAAPMTYIDPHIPPLVAPEPLAGSGLNVPFLMDTLSAMLAHERGGAALYRTVAARSNNPMLQRQYKHFGEETVEHVAILETLIAQSGGDPMYVSPAARATERAGNSLIETTFMCSGSIDLMTAELVMLEAVLLAEVKDHSNWSTLTQLVPKLPSSLQTPFGDATQRVEQQEDEHLGWAKEMRAKMLSLQIESGTMQKVGMAAEEMMAKIKNLFS
ncbi:MAG: hypothetical protein JWL70_360 [Acidimicrobiia bacterium]|nr:hypothetical protein [Acidimicrobiia bacterium]